MNQDEEIAMMRQRIRDYTSGDYTKTREALVALWREAHPEAAAEPPSRKVHPLIFAQAGEVDNTDCPELWVNDVYTVTVRRYTTERVFGVGRGGMIQLGISSHDGTARHDWRDFQAIKNQLAGEECEAIELYPAESRRLDPSNYYTLCGFPGIKRLRIGVERREILTPDEAKAPQRGFESRC